MRRLIGAQLRAGAEGFTLEQNQGSTVEIECNRWSLINNPVNDDTWRIGTLAPSLDTEGYGYRKPLPPPYLLWREIRAVGG
jgi:hypothetical protein